MKGLKIILGVFIVISAAWFVGPTPTPPNYSLENANFSTSFEHSISKWKSWKEGQLFKPGCEPLLHLQDSAKTSYVLLYLHGFSASPEEGAPTHKEIADYFHFNLFAPTLFDHGLITEDPLLNYTAQGAWNSAVEALNIAHGLGDSVIIISTSTGAPLGLQLCRLDPFIAAHIMYSPNVTPVDPAATLLNEHWGRDIAKIVIGGNFRDVEIFDPYYEQYWNRVYRIESLPEMQELCESTFEIETIENCPTPTYIAVWYESDSIQDDVVSVESIRWMYDLLPAHKKMLESFPAGVHVIANGKYSKSQKEIRQSSIQFLKSLGIVPHSIADTPSLR